MSRRPPLILDEPSRLALEQMRDRHAKPYMRERAADLLKIADGIAHARVAQEGLLNPRDGVPCMLDLIATFCLGCPVAARLGEPR